METLIIETARCKLLEFNLEFAKEFYLLNLDPQVLKHTGDRPFKNIKEAESFINSYDQYEKYQMGRWVVKRKDCSTILGWCGLKYHAKTRQVDLGFRFHQRFWNQGFATETAKACLRYGFEKLKLSKIIGRVDPANTASIRVLEKVGMVYKESIKEKGKELFIYEITI